MITATVGQLLINKALPEELRDYSREFDKKSMNEVLQQVARQYPDRYRDVAYELGTLGHKFAQEQGGFAFGPEHLRKSKAAARIGAEIQAKVQRILDDDTLTSKQRREQIILATGRESERQQKEVMEEALAAKNPLALQIISGSRGKPMNLTSLLGSDMLYADHRDRTIPIPVLRSYSQGLSPEEYWAGTYGARRGILATKFATQEAGYFSKQLNAAAHRLVVTGEDDDEYDPQSTRGYAVETADRDNEGALLAVDTGPYKRNTVLTPKILKHLDRIGKSRILVRSPIVGGPENGGLYARDVGVLENGRMPGRGEVRGLTAAAALSEPVSQGQLCLAGGTLVRMADFSVRPIEAVRVGERVLGADKNGKTFPVRVVRRYDNGMRECVRSAFASDTSALGLWLRSTAEHKVLARVGEEDEYAVMPVAELSATHDVRSWSAHKYRLIEQKPIGELLTYDIEVDHPDHLFVLADGLIVSNSAKHSGGVAGQEKAVGGFDLLDQLVQMPKKMRGGAAHATVDGKVDSIQEAPAGGHFVIVDNAKHYVPPTVELKVKVGDAVEAGDVLSDGVPNPAMIIQHKGIGEGRRYFIDTYRDAMRAAGMTAHRRNIELLSRALVNHVRLTDETDDYAPDDVVPYSAVERAWKVRSGYEETSPENAVGKYLEKPVLHYTIGTKVRPSMLKQFDEFGVKALTVHQKPLPFEPHAVRAMYQMQNDPDWMTQMYGSGLKKSLLNSTARGSTSDREGTSFVPSLAYGKDFGADPTRAVSGPRAPYPLPPAPPDFDKPASDSLLDGLLSYRYVAQAEAWARQADARTIKSATSNPSAAAPPPPPTPPPAAPPPAQPVSPPASSLSSPAAPPSPPPTAPATQPPPAAGPSPAAKPSPAAAPPATPRRALSSSLQFLMDNGGGRNLQMRGYAKWEQPQQQAPTSWGPVLDKAYDAANFLAFDPKVNEVVEHTSPFFSPWASNKLSRNTPALPNNMVTRGINALDPSKPIDKARQLGAAAAQSGVGRTVSHAAGVAADAMPTLNRAAAPVARLGKGAFNVVAKGMGPAAYALDAGLVGLDVYNKGWDNVTNEQAAKTRALFTGPGSDYDMFGKSTAAGRAANEVGNNVVDAGRVALHVLDPIRNTQMIAGGVTQAAGAAAEAAPVLANKVTEYLGIGGNVQDDEVGAWNLSSPQFKTRLQGTVTDLRSQLQNETDPSRQEALRRQVNEYDNILKRQERESGLLGAGAFGSSIDSMVRSKKQRLTQLAAALQNPQTDAMTRQQLLGDQQRLTQDLQNFRMWAQ